MKNTDVLKSLFDLGEKILFPADNAERASNGTHKIYNSVSSIVVDNEDKENWFGLIFKDTCIFKNEQTLKNGSKFFQATTEINEVVNRYMPIMDIISSENSIKINLNTTLPIYKGADLSRDAVVISDLLFVGAYWDDNERFESYSPKIYVGDTKYMWEHMYGNDTDSLSLIVTKDNPLYHELKECLTYFEEHPDKKFGVVAKVTVLLKNTAK